MELVISKKLKKKLSDIEGINCVPAVIRKCPGIIFEALTVQPDRDLIFKIIEEARDQGFYIYSFRHKDNDWSEPHYITEKPILVNRFGWFISEEKMKNIKEDDEIRLYRKVTLFPLLNENYECELIENSIFYVYDVDILMYLKNQKKIWDSVMKEIN